MSAGPAPTPLHADETRARHFAEVRASRPFQLSMAGAVLTAIVLGAVVGGLVWAIVAPALAGVAVVTGGFLVADRRAHADFWFGVARSLDMTYRPDVELETLTPLLAAGDRRRCPEWLAGRLPDGRTCGVGNYTFSVRRRDSDGDVHWTHYPFTIGLIDVAPPEGAFVRGLYARPKNVLRIFGERTLPGVDKERVHTESADLAARYDLYRDPDDDPARALEILSPHFVDRLARNPTDHCFDYRGGTLVVFDEGHSEDAGDLMSTLDFAKEVATRIGEEIAESRQARGAEGVRPT